MSWEEIGLRGGAEGAVLAESQCGDFFGTISGASSCLSAGLLFPIAGITRIAARQQDTCRTPREAETTWLRGFAVVRALGTSVSLWEGAGRGCLIYCKGGTPLSGQSFLLPPWSAVTWATGKLPPWRGWHRGVFLLDPGDVSHS